MKTKELLKNNKNISENSFSIKKIKKKIKYIFDISVT